MKTKNKITPLNPQEVLEVAVDGSVKGVALRLGKTKSTIYKMYEDPEFCRYTRFLQLFLAVADETEAGADLLFEDFRARYFAHKLRKARSSNPSEEEWFEQLDAVEREHSEALRVAIRNRNAAAIQKELSESIAAQQELLTLLKMREGEFVEVIE